MSPSSSLLKNEQETGMKRVPRRAVSYLLHAGFDPENGGDMFFTTTSMVTSALHAFR
jgi:hypothetical protein